MYQRDAFILNLYTNTNDTTQGRKKLYVQLHGNKRALFGEFRISTEKGGGLTIKATRKHMAVRSPPWKATPHSGAVGST